MKSSTFDEGPAVQQIQLQRPSAHRRLHAGHVAFMRAVVQGVDVRTSWKQYLGSEADAFTPAEARRVMRWIRDAIAASATRHGRPGTARLVRIDLAPEANAAGALPGLAEFIQMANLDGFSENEQLALYAQKFAALVGRRQRHERLLTRQIDALNRLQQDLAQLPRASDPILHWFDPTLARRLANARLESIEQLVHHMNLHGHRWWAHIQGIGSRKAGRIIDWLKAHATELGMAPARHVSDPAARRTVQQRRQALTMQTAIVPLEKLLLPPSLAGTPGHLRVPREHCRIEATSDLQAMRAWLQARQVVREEGVPRVSGPAATGWEILKSLSHTQRAYWKEAERFYLWLVLERETTLSAAGQADCLGYLAFLSNPGPRWCGPRGHDKGHPAWRPFEGPLTPAATRFARVVLRGLYRFLVEQRYLLSNPWDGLGGAPRAIAGSPMSSSQAGSPRRFIPAAWEIINSSLHRLPTTSANMRLKVAVALLRVTDLRIGEAVAARAADLLPGPAENDTWRMRVPTRTGPESMIDLPLDVVMLLKAYFAARGLAAELQAPGNAGVFLLGKATDAVERAPWAPCARRPIDATAGIGIGTLRDQIAGFFQECAKLSKGEPELARQFDAATSQWLRRGGTGAARLSRARVALQHVSRVS